MKSEKARELIDKYAIGNSRDAAPSLLKRTAILCVEIAEQEAEERMRVKAIDSFTSSCKYQDGCRGANRECAPQQCDDLKLFIQKLNEQ
jgi:hypothetical protein